MSPGSNTGFALPKRRKARLRGQRLKIAGAPGFEPRFTDSKSGVLPLHHAPKFVPFGTRTPDFNTFFGKLPIALNCHLLKIVL